MRALIFCLCFVTCPVLHAADFRAGASAVDVTPKKWPVSMVGSFSDRGATKAFDPLHARALVLDDGKTKLAIVIVDSCYLPRTILDKAKQIAAKKTGIPVTHQLMAATHTHSAPASKRSWAAGAKPSPDYIKQLTQGIADSVIQAHEQRVPAEMGWGKVALPEHVHNRRWFVKRAGIRPNPYGEDSDQVRMNPPRDSEILIRPAGPIDPDIMFLSVRAKKGYPIALLANYSLHYVGGVPRGGVSADYFGAFAKLIESALTPQGKEIPTPVVGMMTNGTSGDINNINFRKKTPRREPFEQIKYVAKSCAEAVLKANAKVKFKDDVTLASTQQELLLKIRKPTPFQMKRAKQYLAETDEKKLPIRAKAYSRRALELATGPESTKVILQAMRIGEIGIAAIPCEVFVEIGLEIKKKSELQPSFTIELANDHFGYLPTPRQHRLGGYETWLGTNMLEIEASEKITKVILDLLGKVAKK